MKTYPRYVHQFKSNKTWRNLFIIIYINDSFDRKARLLEAQSEFTCILILIAINQCRNKETRSQIYLQVAKSHEGRCNGAPPFLALPTLYVLQPSVTPPGKLLILSFHHLQQSLSPVVLLVIPSHQILSRKKRKRSNIRGIK